MNSTEQDEFISGAANYIHYLAIRDGHERLNIDNAGSETHAYIPGWNFNENQQKSAAQRLKSIKHRLETLGRQSGKLEQWALDNPSSGMKPMSVRTARSHIAKALSAVLILQSEIDAEMARVPTSRDPRLRNIYLHRAAYRLAYDYCTETGGPKSRARSLSRKILQAANIQTCASDTTITKWRRELENGHPSLEK